tara:strand:- start:311 stop:574 length:264 start_codon:yes stop_codon:yes gene_type:complete
VKKIFTIIIFLISIVGIAQEENLSQKEILLKAYFSKDSSDYYFQQAKKNYIVNQILYTINTLSSLKMMSLEIKTVHFIMLKKFFRFI